MTGDSQNPNTPENLPSSSSSSSSTKVHDNSSFSGEKARYPNPPDRTNPDAATLREQWKFAIRQYSKWYSHAWGTAILAGVSFFALGWIIKGSNPLPSFRDNPPAPPSSSSDDNDATEARR